MNNTITDGGDLMLFLGKKTLAYATSHKLTINVETTEITSKDNGGGKWKASTAKKMSWTVSSDNLYLEKGDSTKNQNAFGDLFDLMTARQPIEIVFAKTNETEADEIPEEGWTKAATGTYAGKAIITSLDANANSGDNATYTVSLEGVGALTHTPEA